MRFAIPAIVVVLLFGTCLLFRGGDSWDQALAEARSEDKPILLKFGGPW